MGICSKCAIRKRRKYHPWCSQCFREYRRANELTAKQRSQKRAHDTGYREGFDAALCRLISEFNRAGMLDPARIAARIGNEL